MTRAALRPGWYKELVVPGVDPTLSGLYEWRIEGVGCYIGQHHHASRPRHEYARNIARLIAGLPYRKHKPTGYRAIHHALRAAHDEGRAITLTILENETTPEGRQRRETQLVKERRAELGGLAVLNA